MIFNLNYVIYIGYSFSVLFILYLCLLVYKKYSYIIFDSREKIILSEKYHKKKSNKISDQSTSNKIKNIKKYFKIKSTEKTFEDIKYISNKPNHINVNKDNLINNTFENKNIEHFKKIKNFNNDITVKKITNVYLNTKQKFYDAFVNAENNEYFINNFDDFYLFHKNNINHTNFNKNNILLKFFNQDDNKYIYLYVKQSEMIKIIYYEEFDNICKMIEKNNGIFILNDGTEKNKYFIGYGHFIQSDLNLNNLKNIFFHNIKNYELDKNYKLFCEFNLIKIYFYVCNEIIFFN